MAAVAATLLGAGCTSGLRPLLPPTSARDTVRVEQVAPGVRHEYRWEAAGPWAIHVADAELARCDLEVRTSKALDRAAGRERTTQLASRIAARTGGASFASVNGDFFTLKAPQGVSLGAQVVQGVPLEGGTGRPLFGMTTHGHAWFGMDHLRGMLRSADGSTVEMRRVNARPDSAHVALYTTFAGDSTPTDTGAVEIVVHRIGVARSIGDTLVGIVRQVDTASAGVPLHADDVVLAGRSQAAAFLREHLAVGDTVRWSLYFPGAPDAMSEAIGGSALLLRSGMSLAPFAGAAAALRHPRTAVALTRSGDLLLVTVDGRQPGYSAGMTLDELTALLMRLGATDAMNLDGGGSTTMVIAGRVVNRPSDATGERAVGNALSVVGRANGRCR